MARSALNQLVQIAAETTPGTAETTTHRLQMSQVEMQMSLESADFRPTGQKYRSLSILNKDHSTASVSGKANYDELMFWLAGAIDKGVATDPVNAQKTRLHTFTPDTFANNDVPHYTIEQSTTVGADRGHRSTYNTVTEFGMTFTRDSVDFTASLIGQQMSEGPAITLGPGPTTMPLNPIMPGEVSVFIDDTAANLETTQFTRVLSVDFSISNVHSPIWVVDDTKSAWVEPIESEPDVSLTILMEADAQGLQFLSDARAGNTSRFVRIKATGNVIEQVTPDYNWEFIADFAVQPMDTGGFSDNNGLFAIEWNCVGVHDATWGKSMEFAIQNSTGTVTPEWTVPAAVSAV